MLWRRLWILLIGLMIISSWCLCIYEKGMENGEADTYLRRERGVWVWDWLVLHNNCRLQRSIVWVVTTSVMRLRLMNEVRWVSQINRTEAKTYRIQLLIRRYLHKSVTAGIEATSVSSREIWRVSLEMVSG